MAPAGLAPPGATAALVREILLSAVWAGVFLAVLLAAGGRARRAAGLTLPPALRRPVDLLLGAWVAAVFALLCGLAGAFRPPVLLLGAAALAVAGRWRGRGGERGPILAALPGALVVLPVALAVPFFHDALVYHLALPWQWLVEGRIAPHPEDLFAAFPPLAELVAAYPLAAGIERAPAILHLAAFVAAAEALAALAARLGAPAGSARLAAAAFMLLPAIMLVPGLPASEGWAVAAILAALALALPGRADRRRPALAGFLAGLACAARLQGIPWSVLVLGTVALRGSRPEASDPGDEGHAGRAARRGALRDGLRAAAGWVVGSAPWWIRNLALLHDPLAPLGWRRDGMETLWRDASSLLYVTAAPTGLLAGLGRALLPHVAYAAPLALGALLALRSGDRSRLAVAAAAALGILAWGASGALPRFLLPALSCALALAAAAGAEGSVGRRAGGAALGVALLLGAVTTLGELRRRGGLGLLADPGVRARLVPNDPLPGFRAAAGLPHRARVLFVGETRGYAFPRPFSAPSQHDVPPLRGLVEALPDAPSIRDRLCGEGFTHLLINWGEMQRLATRYPIVPWRTPSGAQRFRDLVGLLGPPLLVAGDVEILSLTP